MKKNVFIVSSSPRKNGNSDILAEEFARGAAEVGHSVKKINVRDINLQFCIGCLTCTKTAKCVLKDSMNDLYDSVQNADVLVFATPIYYYAVSGQLKTFLDRLNPLFVRENRFKDVYLLAASAESEKSAMDGAVKDVTGWCDCYEGVRLAGVVYGTGVTDPDDILNTEANQEAYETGKNI